MMLMFVLLYARHAGSVCGDLKNACIFFWVGFARRNCLLFRGAFVAEYCGEVYDLNEFERRQMVHDSL